MATQVTNQVKRAPARWKKNPAAGVILLFLGPVDESNVTRSSLPKLTTRYRKFTNTSKEDGFSLQANRQLEEVHPQPQRRAAGCRLVR
ncbi:hypothetical protein D3C86_1771460 [compost metagenome]